jgi:hypothetical protein
MTLVGSFILYCAARHLGRGWLRPLTESRAILLVSIGFLLLAFIVTFEPLRAICPDYLTALFIPNDKTNLAPYRIIHLLALAAVVTNVLRPDSPLLCWKISYPAILCGQHSLPVFCGGTVIAFIAHAAIEQSANAIAMQIFVGLGGIGAMILIGQGAARNLKGRRKDVGRTRIDDRRLRLRSSGHATERLA